MKKLMAATALAVALSIGTAGTADALQHPPVHTCKSHHYVTKTFWVHTARGWVKYAERVCAK